MNELTKVLIFSLLVISCQNSDKKGKNELLTFDISEKPSITDVTLSDLGFVDIEYIPLGTSDKSPIQYINNVLFSEDYFLTHFYMDVMMFRYDGTFVKKIGTEGRGPNEYTVVHDVDIDKVNQNIYLVDGWQKRFLVFSNKGEIIKTIRTPVSAGILFRITENGILCYYKNSLGNIENSYNLIDTSGIIVNNYPNGFPWTLKQKSTVIFDENLFYRFDNKLYKKEVYSDTVYVFENKIFKPHIVILHGNRLLTPEARSEYEPGALSEKFISQKNLFEFGDFIYYEFMYNYKGGESNILHGFIGSKTNNSSFFINPEQGIINDLDGGPDIRPKTIRDNNTLISWIEAGELIKKVTDQKFKNSTPKYPEKKKELETLAKSLKETDNPILVMVRLKK